MSKCTRRDYVYIGKATHNQNDNTRHSGLNDYLQYFSKYSEILGSVRTYRIHRRLPRFENRTFKYLKEVELIRICKLLVLSLLITGEREQYGRKGKHPFLEI
ncbi:hypothetical protein T10_8660 [Trichinella papuae]|uniref:Uncharacterized protein n=1 Tax=Trichinella papuae TaxID=268474 RepID=A0A0V1MN37_9BILA|nr:hypothetical protein T10_8660 [Trichinella papuae]